MACERYLWIVLIIFIDVERPKSTIGGTIPWALGPSLYESREREVTLVACVYLFLSVLNFVCGVISCFKMECSLEL